ncbi:MAG: GNAT family N-acetyltransferase [Proteobacteria bacterium]|nr:GNAT family N-acetyltransferase [Pseudomonadota bacterium]
MNTPIDLQYAHILKTGTLKKTAGEYSLVLLAASHIDSILALQEVVFATLSDQSQAFLLRKDKDFFEQHFARDSLVLGIIHDGQLVAQSVVVHPTTAHPKTGMVDMALDVPVENITVIQGVIVHPDYQGNRLMTALVDTWLELAEKQGRTHAIAEVAVDNYYSWSIFLKEGMEIDSIGEDPADGTQVYNFHAQVSPLLEKRLKPAFNKASAKNSVPSQSSDLEQQKDLLSRGYKGVSFDAASNVIAFKPPEQGTKPLAKPRTAKRLP